MCDGELSPTGLARTRAIGIERLFDSLKDALNIQELAIVHSTTPSEASSLRERLSSFFTRERIHIARLGPALGVHGGPGTLLLAFRENVSNLKQELTQAWIDKKDFLFIFLDAEAWSTSSVTNHLEVQCRFRPFSIENPANVTIYFVNMIFIRRALV